MDYSGFKGISLDEFGNIMIVITHKIFSTVNVFILPLATVVCAIGAVCFVVGGIIGSKTSKRFGASSIAFAILGVLIFYFIPSIMSGLSSLQPLIEK